MKITVMNKEEAKFYEPEGTAIIVRVGDYFPCRVPLGKIVGKYVNISEYDFPDIAYYTEYSMTDRDAISIANTIKEFSNKVEEIVVHCIYGQGRSPAIAYAFATYVGDTSIDYVEKYDKINLYVYDKIMEQLKKGE